MIVAHAEETGEIEEEEREMLYKVFDFADKEVSDVMVPRPEVVALSIDLPPEECLAAAMEAPYTRYPVYRDSLDNVIGILHIRDLMREGNARGGYENVDVEALLRPAHMVPETKDLAALLHDFRRTKEHLAVVVDEYGATEGIVTLEDLLEEIVGEIEDEFDLPDESVEKLADGRIRISGTFSVDDFNEEFERAATRSTTTTRWRASSSASSAALPSRGTRCRTTERSFTVVDVEGTRIERLEVEFTVGRSRSGRDRATDGQPSAAARALCPARSTGFAVGDEHAVERLLEQRSQRLANGWLAALADPARWADPKGISEQHVPDNDRPLLRQAVDELSRAAGRECFEPAG